MILAFFIELLQLREILIDLKIKKNKTVSKNLDQKFIIGIRIQVPLS